ncbi:hypothetical protein NQ315_010032 [Exocentrus adspersus]|uniref:Protein kinase domain-containing protein n=1 Tax=Exocentrus adspersus TaxID=1586481 RepID=A0AAV8VK27_9CUCU|nr:hypothetical protein NQ315_010032 [Exocentrus adspersus]
MVSGIEVLANVVEHKPTTDDFLEHFHVSPFGFDKSSVRLKISWENAFGNDSFKELFVNDYSSDGYCKYSNSYDVSNHTNLIIIPNSDVKDQFQNILPGCSYKIVLNMGETILWKNYTVPECVGNFCMCITESTDFIKLTNVEFVQGGIYRVTYTYSQDTRLENKSQEITDVFYIKQDTDDKFFVSQGRYLKGAFEVPMEYLKDGENYTLVVRYKNTDNSNPHCEYESRLDFIAHNPGANNYHLITLISITLLLLLAFMLCMCVIWLLSTKTLMKIKKFIFPHEDLVTIQNLEKVPFNLPHQEINIFYTPLELSDNCDEFPRENLILKEVIGEGNFGKVHYAKAYNLNGIHGFSMVAVKQLREGAPNEELADFQAEIEMLKMLKKVGFHRNVVKFLGCVTKSQPYMTIMELVPNGNLKDYLLKLRDVWIKNKKQRRFFPE